MVNVVTFAVAEAMNLTSGEYDSSVDEFALAKLTTRPSQMVRPPQVAESPISFECKLNRIIDFGTEPGSTSLVVGEIVCVHMEDDVVKRWPPRPQRARLDRGAWAERNIPAPRKDSISSGLEVAASDLRNLARIV